MEYESIVVPEKLDVFLSSTSNVSNCEENRLIEIEKNTFNELLDKYDFDPSLFFYDRPPTLRDCHKFNVLLRKLKTNHNVNISDCICYFERDYVYFKRITRILDEENLHIIKLEMEAKYPRLIKEKPNLLFKEKKKDSLLY